MFQYSGLCSSKIVSSFIMGLDYLNSGPVLDLCYKAMYEMHTGKLFRCCLWSDSYQSEKYANDTQAPELRE